MKPIDQRSQLVGPHRTIPYTTGIETRTSLLVVPASVLVLLVGNAATDFDGPPSLYVVAASVGQQLLPVGCFVPIASLKGESRAEGRNYKRDDTSRCSKLERG